MTVLENIEKIESLIASGRVPGTSRSLITIEKVTVLLHEIRDNLPEHMAEAQGVLRQKEAILKQAELESKRLRNYADEEATTIRQLAEEQANTALTSARRQAETMVLDQEVVKAAHDRAQNIIKDAEVRAQHIISEGKGKVNVVIGEAERQADERRKGADTYAREVLFTLEESVSAALGQVRSGLDLLDHRAAAAAAD